MKAEKPLIAAKHKVNNIHLTTTFATVKKSTKMNSSTNQNITHKLTCPRRYSVCARVLRNQALYNGK